MITVSNLLRRAINGIDYLIRNNSDLISSPYEIEVYVKKAKSSIMSLERLDDDDLLDLFKNELATNYLNNNKRTEQFQVINKIHSQVFMLWDTLGVYQNTDLSHLSKIVPDADIYVFERIRHYANEASSENIWERAYFTIHEIIDIYFSESERTNHLLSTFNAEAIQVALSQRPNTKFKWRGSKTDFAELVWALAKSQRIIDNTTNKPVTIDMLANQLGSLFGMSISNPKQLMQARKDSFKASEDGITFITSLSELVEQYIGSK
ncbi:RteC domain-containing protein [Larkinella soli]|uniref:RteC domain-containing protein n=1 Tax=Larkinella soli TaxID=1770527 RepID=UPI0013E3FEFA|nr:RteC domain-containing protein [Larkinella soli]